MGLWRSQVAHRTLNPVVKGPNPFRPASFFVIEIRPDGSNYLDRTESTRTLQVSENTTIFYSAIKQYPFLEGHQIKKIQTVLLNYHYFEGDLKTKSYDWLLA